VIARAEGQATVELVGILPVCVAVALGAGQLLAAGAAHELAGTAAQAGAMAILQGGDPARAARAAVPGWSRSRMDVRVRGGRVRVRLRPVALVPGVAGSLSSEVTADAGPRP
jgi:hypothetical protein